MQEEVYTKLFELEDYHWWFRGRREVIWALLDAVKLPEPARVLDAGCGTGRNLVEFRQLGDGFGVDPSPQAVDFCHQRGLHNVSRAGIEELPYEDEQFDLILALDVIEHIEDDRAALRELRRVVAPTGRLLITVPAYQWLWSHHDETHHHYRRYTLPRLREVVAASGWRAERDTYFNSLLLAPIAAVRAVSRRSANGNGNGSHKRSDYEISPAPLNRLLEMPMRAEARAIARGHRFPAGVSVGMVCSPA